MITEPTTSTVWVNGAANLVTWTKGLLDNIHAFDVEIARLSQDGLIFVAKDGEPSSCMSEFILYPFHPAATAREISGRITLSATSPLLTRITNLLP